MTFAWSENEPRSFGVRGRLIAFGSAAFACLGLAYLAFTQRFDVMADMFSDASAVSVIVEDDPPKPPPIVRPPPPALPPLQQQSQINPTAPPTMTTEIVMPQAPIAPGPVYIDATFTQRPSGSDFERYFPRRAIERGISGRVVLDCRVAENGRIACAVESEAPVGWGFGDASLRAAQEFRVAPAAADGHPTSGGRLRVPMTWRVN